MFLVLRQVHKHTGITFSITTIITVVSELARMETDTNCCVCIFITDKCTHTIIKGVETPEPVTVIDGIHIFYDTTFYSIYILDTGFIC